MIYRLARFTALAGFLLVIAGGLVTSTDSGLAVPDWPLSYGTLFPPMVGGIRFEHTHRVIASAVGALTLILTLTILLKESRLKVRRLALAALGLVVFQGILGGLTVLWRLPKPVSVAHACLGQLFFALLCVLAMVVSPRWRDLRRQGEPSALLLSTLTTLALVLQLFLGAFLRHTGTGLAYHLLGGALVSAGIFALTRKLLRTGTVSLFLPAVLFLQLALGALTLLTRNAVPLATAHVAAGAILLAASSVWTVRLFSSRPACLARLSAYGELAKPRLTLLAVAVSLVGFLFGSSHGALDPLRLLAELLGVTLVGAGAGALNQYLERGPDALMNRTKNRPLPSGRLSPPEALGAGVLTSAAGILILWRWTFPLAGWLAAATLAAYLFLYTPLKARSALCTLAGAVPGALPPLIGWAASGGSLNTEAWLLFGILFLWQLPHFLAIAWTHREDYRRAGFKMLPVLDPEGWMTGRQITLYTLALIPVSLLHAAVGSFGILYFFAALAAGGFFFSLGVSTACLRSLASARRLFVGSLIYLPFLLTAMTLDRLIG
ncbi:MAG: protoheme IX farnesyltransferase [Candidatus Omnitrophica bacterium]|nr:protoheme IX farnesyltransferase [Candidatus Omnitrophota bacterium]